MESAASAKGRGVRNPRPREGTKLRAIHDLFVANKGIPIAFSTSGAPARARIEQLRNFYGLDIRCLARGRWVLAGEWYGSTYVDYIADVIHKADRRRAQ